MELRPVLGSTYVADGATALLPIYKLNSTDIVLLDTGYAKLDRSALTHLLDDNGFHLKGILCSHAHFDHTGNVRYLQQRYGALAAAQLIEAGISVNPDAYRANYVALTYGRSRAYFLEECFTADVIIPADATELTFCGAKFGILQLPGHSAGHIGIVTPDGVAYLGDGLISRSVKRMEHDEQTGMDPAKAGAFVGKVALKTGHKPLYTIGFSYKAAVLLTKILPARALNWLIGKIYAS